MRHTAAMLATHDLLPLPASAVPASPVGRCHLVLPGLPRPLGPGLHRRRRSTSSPSPGRVNSLWRYEEALPLAAPAAVSLGEGRTPLVPLTGTVSAKLDFLMPTLSFKDRGAVMLGGTGPRGSRPERVIADSSGNAGTAVAAYCARAGLRLHGVRPRGHLRQEGGADPGARRASRTRPGRPRGHRARRPARRRTDPAPSTPATSTTRTSCTARRPTSTSCGRTSAAGSPRRSSSPSATAHCSSAPPSPSTNSTPTA